MNKHFQQYEKMMGELKGLMEVEENILTDPITPGKWSIREIVGHLYYWDKFNLEIMVPNMSDNKNLPPFPNHDEQNEKAIAELEGKTVATILDLFMKTRKSLIASLLAVDQEIRFTIGKGKRQFSAESFIKIFIKHDAHHLRQIKAKLDGN